MNILRLKEVLKEKKTTGKQLAEMVGVSQPAISDIAKGKSFPRPELLLEISKVLDIDIKDLFNSTKDSEKVYLIIKDTLHTFDSLNHLKEYVSAL